MRFLRRMLLIVLLLAVFFYWQNFMVQAEHVSVKCDGLPSRFDGLRIVQISDLHGRCFGEDNEKLLSAVKEAEPDMVCITGDLFNTAEQLRSLLPFLHKLCEIVPTYYVTGNHEWQTENLHETLAQMEAVGVQVLRNEYVHLGEGFVIAGVDDPCGPYDQKTPEQLVGEIHTEVGEESFIVMLDHRNDRLELWAELGVGLVLSGHCHGGVVRLPYVGGLFGTKRELFPDFDAGLYRHGHTQLYVSRGLGYSRVHLRLFNRPHLPVLILES